MCTCSSSFGTWTFGSAVVHHATLHVILTCLIWVSSSHSLTQSHTKVAQLAGISFHSSQLAHSYSCSLGIPFHLKSLTLLLSKCDNIVILQTDLSSKQRSPMPWQTNITSLVSVQASWTIYILFRHLCNIFIQGDFEVPQESVILRRLCFRKIKWPSYSPQQTPLKNTLNNKFSEVFFRMPLYNFTPLSIKVHSNRKNKIWFKNLKYK